MKICTNCERYVKNEESACPFCKSESLQQEVTPSGTSGMSRARIYATRAALTGVAIGAAVACGDDDRDEENTDAVTGGTANGDGDGDAATGGDGIDLGGNGNNGGDGGEPSYPIYGGPFPDMMKARV